MPALKPTTLQFFTVTAVLPIRVIPVFKRPLPLMVCPAQLSVIPSAPMLSPSPEQGPMLAVRVVDAVIVEPQAGVAAYTGTGRKASAETTKVAMSSTAEGTTATL